MKRRLGGTERYNDIGKGQSRDLCAILDCTLEIEDLQAAGPGDSLIKSVS